MMLHIVLFGSLLTVVSSTMDMGEAVYPTLKVKSIRLKSLFFYLTVRLEKLAKLANCKYNILDKLVILVGYLTSCLYLSSPVVRY